MKYSTTNGTALAGIDYVGLTNVTASFAGSVFTNNFNVQIISHGIIYNQHRGENVWREGFQL